MDQAINIYRYPLSRAKAAAAGGMTPAQLNNHIARHSFLQMSEILKENRLWDFEEVLIIGAAKAAIDCGVPPSLACGVAMSNGVPGKWIMGEPLEIVLPVFGIGEGDENPRLTIPLDPIAERGARVIAGDISKNYGEDIAQKSIAAFWENRDLSRKHNAQSKNA